MPICLPVPFFFSEPLAVCRSRSLFSDAFAPLDSPSVSDWASHPLLLLSFSCRLVLSPPSYLSLGYVPLLKGPERINSLSSFFPL